LADFLTYFKNKVKRQGICIKTPWHLPPNTKAFFLNAFTFLKNAFTFVEKTSSNV